MGSGRVGESLQEKGGTVDRETSEEVASLKGKWVTEKTVESVAGFLWGMKIARAA